MSNIINLFDKRFKCTKDILDFFKIPFDEKISNRTGMSEEDLFRLLVSKTEELKNSILDKDDKKNILAYYGFTILMERYLKAYIESKK